MDQVTAIALAIALVVNLAVLVGALVWARRGRNEARAYRPAADEVVSASGPWWSDRAERLDRNGGQASAAAEPTRPRAVAVVALDEARREEELAHASEVLAALESPEEWRTNVDIEAARVSRYGRSATVVVAELEGLDRLGARLGQDSVDRLLPAVAASLRREARISDRMARLAQAQFAVMLPETTEIAAINWVERVRDATDLWLEASAVSLRLSFGWAELGPDADVDGTIERAKERLDNDRRATRTPGRGAGSARRTPPAQRPRRALPTDRPSSFADASGSLAG